MSEESLRPNEWSWMTASETWPTTYLTLPKNARGPELLHTEHLLSKDNKSQYGWDGTETVTISKTVAEQLSVFCFVIKHLKYMTTCHRPLPLPITPDTGKHWPLSPFWRVGGHAGYTGGGFVLPFLQSITTATSPELCVRGCVTAHTKTSVSTLMHHGSAARVMLRNPGAAAVATHSNTVPWTSTRRFYIIV